MDVGAPERPRLARQLVFLAFACGQRHRRQCFPLFFLVSSLMGGSVVCLITNPSTFVPSPRRLVSF